LFSSEKFYEVIEINNNDDRCGNKRSQKLLYLVEKLTKINYDENGWRLC
jgi:hypothetical protein